MLRGKRAIQLHEARQLADVLDIPLIDVLRHAGIATHEEGTRVVPIAGTIDKNGELHLIQGKETIPGPGDLPAEAIAVRYTTARSEHDMIDGWLLFTEKPGPLRPEVIGRLCLVGPKKGRPQIAFVLRGYKGGTVNLVAGPYGTLGSSENNVHLEWIAPVLWIRPQQ